MLTVDKQADEHWVLGSTTHKSESYALLALWDENVRSRLQTCDHQTV